MQNMILVVVGMFVLVWIVSAVMKATQSANPKPPARPLPPNRNRQNNQQQPEKTTNSDLERFMAEIDKLRTRGEAAPKPAPRPQPQPQRANQPAAARADRPPPNRRANNRKGNAPPPLPAKTADVPVLRPVTPAEPMAPTGGATSHTLAGFKQAKMARTAASGGGTERESVSPVLQTIQQILRSNQGPAVALVLKEIFGEPRCRQRHGAES